MNLDRYLSFLEPLLTPKRLEHSLGVMQVMGELAGVYSLDQERAMTVGLLHDAAKDLGPDQQIAMVEESGVAIRHPSERDWTHYLHGPIGAYLVSKELGITDKLVLDAISMHTYCGDGRNFHAPICWCVRFSDILEPTRDWRDVELLHKGVSRLRKVVYAGQLRQGALLQTCWLVEWFEATGRPIHPNMRRVCREYRASEGRPAACLGSP